MKYKYRILWFEDNYEPLQERCQKDLTAYLDNLGYELTIDWEPAQLTNPTEREYKKYDLIVTDLNFSEAGKKDTAGVAILNEVRDYRILTDVLIYSSSAELLAKAKENLESPPERVSFCGGHTDLPGKVKRLVDLSVNKLQTLPTIRGLVISEAIDLEILIGDIAHKYFSRTDKLRRRSKVSRARDYKKRKIKFATKKIREIRAIDSRRLDTFCRQDAFLAFDQLQLLLGATKDAKEFNAELLAKEPAGERKNDLKKIITELESIAKDLAKFDEEVIRARNTLAHTKAEERGDTLILKSRSSGGKETPITHAWCVQMRKTVRKHTKSLLQLSALL